MFKKRRELGEQTAGDPAAEHVLLHRKKGDWREIMDTLDGAADASTRSHLVRIAADDVLEGRPKWIDEWREHAPRSGTAALVGGANSVKLAWLARGAAWKPRDLAGFMRFLQQAEPELDEAVRLAPDDPAPWAHKIAAAKGLQLGGDQIEFRIYSGLERDPFNREIHSEGLQALAQKWGGSDERMMAFARDAAESAPAGALCHAAILEAAIEQMFTTQRSTGVDPRVYFKSMDQVELISQAAQRFYSGEVQGGTFDQLWIHSHIALSAYFSGQGQLLKKSFKFIGKNMLTLPWGYWGKAELVFKEARRHA